MDRSDKLRAFVRDTTIVEEIQTTIDINNNIKLARSNNTKCIVGIFMDVFSAQLRMQHIFII